MISKEEIQKLAELARIEIKDGEMESLRNEIDAILDYVGQVRSVAGGRDSVFSPNRKKAIGGVINVMRDDTDPTASGTYSKELIAEFPNREGDYLKVKKIL